MRCSILFFSLPRQYAPARLIIFIALILPVEGTWGPAHRSTNSPCLIDTDYCILRQIFNQFHFVIFISLPEKAAGLLPATFPGARWGSRS